MRNNEPDVPKPVSSLPAAKLVSLDHAVRWLATGQPFLNYDDQDAVGDNPDIAPDEFDEAKQNLMLALRHGQVRASGLLELYGEGHDEFCEWSGFGNACDEFLEDFKGHLAKSRVRMALVGDDIAIPAFFWTAERLDWTGAILHYAEGPIQARWRWILIDAKSRRTAFSAPRQDGSEPTGQGRTSQSAATKERNSLLKLVIGMAVKGYTYKPNAGRQGTAKEISEDLAALGISMDEDTVRDYLRKAADECLPTDPSSDER